jgi:hypothetical protein
MEILEGGKAFKEINFCKRFRGALMRVELSFVWIKFE